jgi:hypothetical protein
MTQPTPDLFNGQFDAVFAAGVKTRQEYQGNYESYLRGVAQVEERQQKEKPTCK